MGVMCDVRASRVCEKSRSRSGGAPQATTRVGNKIPLPAPRTQPALPAPCGETMDADKMSQNAIDASCKPEAIAGRFAMIPSALAQGLGCARRGWYAAVDSRGWSIDASDLARELAMHFWTATPRACASGEVVHALGCIASTLRAHGITDHICGPHLVTPDRAIPGARRVLPDFNVAPCADPPEPRCLTHLRFAPAGIDSVVVEKVIVVHGSMLAGMTLLADFTKEERRSRGRARKKNPEGEAPGAFATRAAPNDQTDKPVDGAAQPGHAPPVPGQEDSAASDGASSNRWYVVYPHHRVPDGRHQVWPTLLAHYWAVCRGLREAGVTTGSGAVDLNALGIAMAARDGTTGEFKFFNVEAPCASLAAGLLAKAVAVSEDPEASPASRYAMGAAVAGGAGLFDLVDALYAPVARGVGGGHGRMLRLLEGRTHGVAPRIATHEPVAGVPADTGGAGRHSETVPSEGARTATTETGAPTRAVAKAAGYPGVRRSKANSRLIDSSADRVLPVLIGRHCQGCDYLARCRPDRARLRIEAPSTSTAPRRAPEVEAKTRAATVAKMSIFDLSGLSRTRMAEVYYQPTLGAGGDVVVPSDARNPRGDRDDGSRPLARRRRIPIDSVRDFSDIGALLSADDYLTIDREGLREFLKPLIPSPTHPVSYLDFETIQFAVPRGVLHATGALPYSKIPIQYSLYVDRRGGGCEALARDEQATLQAHCDAAAVEELASAAYLDRDTTLGADGRRYLPEGLTHREFLSLDAERRDVRRAIAESLVAHLPLVHVGDAVAPSGTVVVWSSFEKQVLQELATAYPDLAPKLLPISDAVVDLMTPFTVKRRLYRDLLFQNSKSLKKIAHVMCPGLSYRNDNLPPGASAATVGDGWEATAVLRRGTRGMYNAPSAARRCQTLLRYCRLDTAAMLGVAGALQRAVL